MAVIERELPVQILVIGGFTFWIALTEKTVILSSHNRIHPKTTYRLSIVTVEPNINHIQWLVMSQIKNNSINKYYNLLRNIHRYQILDNKYLWCTLRVYYEVEF
jgi:hypothetical protein